mmetsp:Transcript_35716/g.44326  ORF Transcript_35716/g.44326 Transcript_35716/m.44326 type:complete len:226 (-) Transcript_35716:1595-2272(-)
MACIGSPFAVPCFHFVGLHFPVHCRRIHRRNHHLAPLLHNLLGLLHNHLGLHILLDRILHRHHILLDRSLHHHRILLHYIRLERHIRLEPHSQLGLHILHRHHSLHRHNLRHRSLLHRSPHRHILHHHRSLHRHNLHILRHRIHLHRIHLHRNLLLRSLRIRHDHGHRRILRGHRRILHDVRLWLLAHILLRDLVLLGIFSLLPFCLEFCAQPHNIAANPLHFQR